MWGHLGCLASPPLFPRSITLYSRRLGANTEPQPFPSPAPSKPALLSPNITSPSLRPHRLCPHRLSPLSLLSRPPATCTATCKPQFEDDWGADDWLSGGRRLLRMESENAKAGLPLGLTIEPPAAGGPAGHADAQQSLLLGCARAAAGCGAGGAVPVVDAC